MWVNGVLMCAASGQTLTNKAQIIQGGNQFGATPTGFVSYSDDYSQPHNTSLTPPLAKSQSVSLLMA